MSTAYYESFGLHQTVHVAVDGTVTHGMEVPHEGANLLCFQRLGTTRDPANGIEYRVLCRKRAGHHTNKGDVAHVPVDWRLVAAPSRVVHGRRFSPGGIPAGVDQQITAPHDCENHLDG